MTRAALVVVALACSFGCRPRGPLDGTELLAPHVREWTGCAEISVDWIGPDEDGFAIEGCGERATVRCRWVAPLSLAPHYECVRSGGAADWAAEVGAWLPTDVPTAGAEVPAVEHATPPDRPLDPHASVRRLLDENAAPILGCAGRDEQAVRVSRDGDGPTQLGFQGELAGSPEEACLQSALRGIPLELAPGVTVVHFVRLPQSSPR